MSVRGVISGVAGSAAVAVIAALSLGMAHAAADPKPARASAHADVTPAVQAGAAPALKPTTGPSLPQPAWLRRLLQRSEPPMTPAPMDAKPMEATHRRS